MDVPLTGTGLGALIAAPSSRFFGSVEVCSPPITSTITLTNTGNVSLAIAALSIDNPAFTLAPPSVDPVRYCSGSKLQSQPDFLHEIDGHRDWQAEDHQQCRERLLD